jgi:hypothetical protein
MYDRVVILIARFDFWISLCVLKYVLLVSTQQTRLWLFFWLQFQHLFGLILFRDRDFANSYVQICLFNNIDLCSADLFLDHTLS